MRHKVLGTGPSIAAFVILAVGCSKDITADSLAADVCAASHAYAQEEIDDSELTARSVDIALRASREGIDLADVLDRAEARCGASAGMTNEASEADQATVDATTTTQALDSAQVTIDGVELPVPPEPDSGLADPAIGMRAPSIIGSSPDGAPVTVATGGGTAYVLVFLAPWSPQSGRAIEGVLAWASGNSPTDTIEVVGILTAIDPMGVNYPPGPWLSSRGWGLSTVLDQSQGARQAGVAASAFGVDTYPAYVAVDASGLVVERVSGTLDAAAFGDLVDRTG